MLQTATHHNAPTAEQSTPPADFVPLHLETRTHVTTAVMCRHLGRKEQTARGWACHEDGPLRPVRVHGRLAWPVAEIKRVLGVAQ
ncbi:MAG: DNA-binding protein [Rhodoferax sp.]|nr:DNA-binding protein [Rhodoferax sp.]